MKILHTSDWHLGHHLKDKDRHEEHSAFFSWLCQHLKENPVDTLLISGDLFDNTNPSSNCRALFHQFLKRLVREDLAYNVIVIGGNHDSPAVLESTGGILELLNLYFIGSIGENISPCILPLKDRNGEYGAIVAAIPFLRPHHYKGLLEAQNPLQVQSAIENSVKSWYHELYDHAHNARLDLGLPILPLIAMGHLYAAGSIESGSERKLHIGHSDQMPVEVFPQGFDYIALGHLHRAQKVAGRDHIRYSGSPLPFSLAEAQHFKYLLEIQIEINGAPVVKEIPVPTFRSIQFIQGSFLECQNKLEELSHAPGELTLRPWAEIEIHSEHYHPHEVDHLIRLAQELNVELLGSPKMINPNSLSSYKEWDNTAQMNLEFTPESVFQELFGEHPQCDSLKILYQEVLQEIALGGEKE